MQQLTPLANRFSHFRSNTCAIQQLNHASQQRGYRARIQQKTKARFFAMNKYLKQKKKSGHTIPQHIITDIDAAELSQESSLLQREYTQNIPSISDRFFQTYFMRSFNECKSSQELRTELAKLKGKMNVNSMDKSSELQEFESNVLRLGYHSCIARCSYATNNEINDGNIDLYSILNFFNEMKSMQLDTFETYTFILDGYINDYNRFYKENGKQIETENGNENENGIILQTKHSEIQYFFKEFEVFMNLTDFERASNVVTRSKYHQTYIAEQNTKYSEIYSLIIAHLCNTNGKDDLVSAIEYFYDGLKRYIVPSANVQILLMDSIANETKDPKEVARIFRILCSYQVDCNSIDYFNQYLVVLAKLGDMDEALKVLRLLVFKKYWNYMSIADAPSPNLQTFENTFFVLKSAIEKNFLTQDKGARKAEFVLQQMKIYKIGTPKSVYVLLYEALGVAWWESLPWHLRLHNRP